MVTVVGNQPVEYSLQKLMEAFPVDERTFTIQCASSGTSVETWRSISVADLIIEAEIPDTATHLLVEGGDDYTAPVSIHDAMNAYLGLIPVSDVTGAPRLLGRNLTSEQAVQHVVRIDWLELAADEDPLTYASW